MKQAFCILVIFMMAFNIRAEDLWVSDEIEAPLRSAPELNSKIVSLLKSGQRVYLLEKNKDYVKIRTVDGEEGWLSNYYVLWQQSVHEHFAPIKKTLKSAEKKILELSSEIKDKDLRIKKLQTNFDNTKKTAGEVFKRAKARESGLAKLTADNDVLQKKLSEQNSKLKQLAPALDAANQKASNARTRYLSLVKVSENAVDIDKQNRSLQKRAVQFEQQLQQLKTENHSLKAKIGKKEFVIGALTVLGGVLVGYILSVIMPPRGGRWPSKRHSYSL